MSSALLIRVSSLGDVVQTFPAITELKAHVPALRLDWVVEEAYQNLVALHPGVARAIPFALRRWRKNLFESRSWEEAMQLRYVLRTQAYAKVIDAQGLLKSLAIAKMSGRKPLHGFGPATVREPFVARFYDYTHEFAADEHRLWHYRGLLGAAFGYEVDRRIESIDYGLRVPAKPQAAGDRPYCVLLHSTARAEKLWPEARWIALGRGLAEKSLSCVLPWGNPSERARAERLMQAIPGAVLPPALTMEAAAGLLAHAAGVIGVDTGLMHLAVAYKVPVVGIYLATRPGHHGPLGAGPTAFCGGMNMNPDVDAVLGALQKLAPELA